MGQYWHGMMRLCGKRYQIQETDNSKLTVIMECYEHAREIYRKIKPFDHPIHKDVSTELDNIRSKPKQVVPRFDSSHPKISIVYTTKSYSGFITSKGSSHSIPRFCTFRNQFHPIPEFRSQSTFFIVN
jgi:hypothetical protein